MEKRSPALEPNNIDRTDPTALFTALQGMHLLGVSRTTFYDLNKKGLLHKPLKIGKASRWKRQWLEQCVDALCDNQKPDCEV